MGYQLDYSVSGGVLMVTISGSCPTPGAIARDIGREARENAVRNVLVDVRRLQDRIGKIRDLLAEKDGPKRIAILDNVLNERLYVFAEIDARARGCALRRFDTQVEAMRWLEGVLHFPQQNQGKRGLSLIEYDSPPMGVHQNFINGDWAQAREQAPNINPSNTSDVVGEFARADEAQARAAIAAARAAAPGWARGPIQARADLLDKIGNEILARKEELGTLLAREEGKTKPEAVGEATRAGYLFKFFAGEVVRQAGEVLPSVRPGIKVEITREPMGVVGIITPWNFPLAIPAWKIAPALAYGNCVVFKPADLVPGCAWALTEIISKAGVPPGVFNLVMGRGSVLGEILSNSPEIDAVSFTGSVAVGKKVAQNSAARLAKVQLEMGGKNPQVVLDDADLDVAVNLSLQSAFFSTGQRCTASSRLIVTQGIHDRFVKALTDKMSALRVDDALKAGTDIGPVVDERQLEQDLKYIALGKKEGAKLAAGGNRLERATQGYFLEPALFVDSTPTMTINREEIFGPVASVIRVKDYDEALAVANDTPFGLSSGIATTSLKYAEHFKRNSAAGMVMVNLPTAGVDYHVPFGGRKGSSYGPREQGRYAAEFYTTVKTAYVNP